MNKVTFNATYLVQLFAILLISVNMLCPFTTPKPDHMYLPSAVSPILFLLFVISRMPLNVAKKPQIIRDDRSF